MAMFENDQETLMQEAWAVYSPPSKGGVVGEIPGEQVLVLMRLLGVVPDEEEATNIKAEFHSYEDFQKLMQGRVKDAESTDDLERGFNVFDRDGKGSIHQDDFRAMLGDLLSAGEIDSILQQADIDADGHLDYVLLSEMLMKKQDGTEGDAPRRTSATPAADPAPATAEGGEEGAAPAAEGAAPAAEGGEATATAAAAPAAEGSGEAAPAAAPEVPPSATEVEAAPAAAPTPEEEESSVTKVKSGKRVTVVAPAEETSEKAA